MNKNGNIVVWIVTVVLAAGIIAGAVYVSRQNSGSLPSSAAQTSQPSKAGKAAVEKVPAQETVIQAEKKEESAKSLEQKAPVSPAATSLGPAEPLTEAAVQERIPTIQELAQGNYSGQMQVSSPRIAEGLRMPLDFTCYRSNTSPPVVWSDAPKKTKSFVLMLTRNSDPDDPFANWILFNIGPEHDRVRPALPKKDMFEGGMAHAKSDYRNIGYIGPCEPKGRIPYSFRLFALDEILDLAPASSKEELLKAMKGHVIDYAEYKFEHYQRF